MTVELILAGIVGFVAGLLVAFWWDSQTLVRRVQDANIEKKKAFEALQKAEIKYRAVEQQVQVMQAELTTAVQDNSEYEATIARQLAEIEASREQVQITVQVNEELQESLQEEQARLEEMEGLRLEAEEQLQTAVSENNRLLGDVQLMEGEIVTLEAKVEQAAQTQPMAAEIEQKVMAAEAQLAMLEAEKDAAKVQLEQAELTNVEQNAKIAGLLKQIQDTEALQEQLTAANEKLETADNHIQTLQSKMDDVQTKMNYSGKSQLQLIQGIGPTYGRRLNEFGIQTFADLAECDAEQIADIIKKKKWQAVNIGDWIDEARALAARLAPDD
jgi:predicted flap endonuclease-1-like 5' DNA nuclease